MPVDNKTVDKLLELTIKNYEVLNERITKLEAYVEEKQKQKKKNKKHNKK